MSNPPLSYLARDGMNMKPTSCSRRLLADVENGMQPNRASEHRLWRLYSGDDGADVQAEGYKASVIASTTSWHVCAALAMTTGFALLVVNPKPASDRHTHTELYQHSEYEVAIARMIFISLVLLSITCSLLGVFVASYFLHDAHMVPAALYSQLAHAMPKGWNVGTPLAVSTLGLTALSATATPLSFLLYGRSEAILAFSAHAIMVTALEAVHVRRLYMWRTLETRCGERPGRLALPTWSPMTRGEKLFAIVTHAILLGPSQLPLLVEMLGMLAEMKDTDMVLYQGDGGDGMGDADGEDSRSA